MHTVGRSRVAEPRWLRAEYFDVSTVGNNKPAVYLRGLSPESMCIDPAFATLPTVFRGIASQPLDETGSPAHRIPKTFRSVGSCTIQLTSW